MKYNPYFIDRCSMALKIAEWASLSGFVSVIVLAIAAYPAFEWYLNWVQCNMAFLPVTLQGLLIFFVIPSVAIFVLVFVAVLSLYRTPEERQDNRDRKRVRTWVSKVESLSSLADLSVEYFNAYEAEQYSEQLVENLQSRLQKLENISQCDTEGVRVCSQCGAVLSPHSNICEYCGTSFAVKSGDVALPAFANDTKINEHISKLLEEIAVAEDFYKTNNLKKRHLYCDMTEKLDMVKAELEALGYVFVWQSYPCTRFFGNCSNSSKMIDVRTVDRILGSNIVYFVEQEKEYAEKY